MSAIYRRGRAAIHANMTPMIDVTFLLIVFFVLVSQIVEVENERMEIPELTDPATSIAGDDQRVVINVLPGPDGTARGYRVGGREFQAGDAGLQGVESELTALLRANPRLDINLRADQRAQYDTVQPVLQTISTAAGLTGIDGLAPRVNLVVIPEDRDE